MAWLRGARSARSGGDEASSRGGSKAPSEAAGDVDLSGADWAPAFRAGEFVEYYSATASRWIPARVTRVNPQGTYGLDCKPDVPPDKVRRPQRPTPAEVIVESGGPEYAIGDRVEYLSATTGSWIPARVVARTPLGTYDLDCKPGVAHGKIRKASSHRSGSSRGQRHRSNDSQSSAASAAPSAAPRVVLQEPLQLIRVSREGPGGACRYEVCEEAAEVLERQGGRKISVCAICGPHRTGKSYLLNLLLQRAQRGLPPAQVSGAAGPCTRGIWLWGAPPEEEEGDPLIAFLDCEGFGSAEGDRTQDAQLFTLCSLLSSVLVLNTSGVLSEGVLRSVSFACRFAEHVDEAGGEANRPTLFWLLRDFALELVSQAGQPMSPDEYLEQTLAASPQDASRSQEAQEVRQSLQRFFGRRACRTLVRPVAEEEALQSLAAVPYGELRPEFRAGFEAARASLVEAARAAPKAVAGQALSCAALVALARQLVEALSGGRPVSVGGAWAAVQHSACGELADRLRREVCLRLRGLATGEATLQGRSLPLAEEALRELLEAERQEMAQLWEEHAIGDEDVRRDYWRELEASVAREEAAVRLQNVRAADRALAEAGARWRDWVDGEAPAWAEGERLCGALGDVMRSAPGAAVARAAAPALEAAGRRVATAAVEGGGGGDEGLRRALSAERAARSEAEARGLELEELQALLEETTRQAEEAAERELEARSQLREAESREASARGALDRSRASAMAAESERSQAVGSAERELQELLEEALAERDAARAMAEQAEAEVERLATAQGGGEEAELFAQLHAARNDLQSRDLELQAANAALERARGEATSARHGAPEGFGMRDDERLERERLLRLERDRYAEAARIAEAEQLGTQRLLRMAQWDADSAREEAKRLREELGDYRARAQSLEALLERERNAVQGAHTEARDTHLKAVEAHQQRLEAHHKAQADVLGETRGKLLKHERDAGILEGKVEALTAEIQRLREQDAEWQERLRRVETQKGQFLQEKEHLRAELKEAKGDVSRAMARIEEAAKTQQAAEAEAAKLRAEVMRRYPPKCGCAMQ